MVDNPYTPGQIPRILAGRRAELRRIEDRLARVVAYGELGGPLLVFHAPRGLGKTSLLRAAERNAETMGFASAWVACSRERQVLPELVRSLQTALERSDAMPRGGAGGRWRKRLQSVTVEVGLPGAKVQASVASPPAATEEPIATAPIAALEGLLHDTATLVRRRGGAGLLLFLDELHTASADDMSVLLNTLQNLDGHREDNPLAVVAAGLPVTPEALTRAATFGERSAFVSLDVLSDEDARALLVGAAAAEDVTWSDRALQAVIAESRGYPYLLQLIGSTTWEAAPPLAGGQLDLADVRKGLPAARDQLAAMHRARWGAASPLQKSFLAAMAAAGVDNVTRAEIAERMGRDSRSISVPRDRLIEKGVIEPVGHGLVRFTLPEFGAFVRSLDDA
ncbi:ATP-binding protein [Nocardioides humilatus]|uniref:ATP-binding protein n=1 Tax=Nocardioides humilatus TaxID=2607660 RepID=A0A5B1LP56_9ACTN|nr:ATP-binding protein [Nocardioides humilatus]KAA1421387.1 ATP-binding protein [Nocardioides humilatus]